MMLVLNRKAKDMKIKVKNLLTTLGVTNLDQAIDLDLAISTLQSVRDTKLNKEQRLDKNNRVAKKDIRSLVKQKKDFQNESYSVRELKSKVGLTLEEIEKIPTTTKFGESRFMKQDIFNFMNARSNKDEQNR
jgi:hypothetical protein